MIFPVHQYPHTQWPEEPSASLFRPSAYSLEPRAFSSGFTFVEILAAILVIAIGLIGVAALYSEGIRKGRAAEPQTQAAELAASIAARIEANSSGRIGYISAIGVVCDANAKPKQPDDAAAQEAACWEDEVEQKLPSGLGTISRDQTTTPPTYVVAVSWSAPATGAASYVIRVQPTE